MPSSRNDQYKRKCAQALNHLAGAVLDVNHCYEEFSRQTQMLKGLPEDVRQPNHDIQVQRYEEMTENLKAAMMGAMVVHAGIVAFIKEAWELDEESIMVYAG